MKYALVNGKILDGTKDMKVQEGMCLLVNGEEIEDILPIKDAEKKMDFSSYEKIDLQGGYVMPGLINMHVHLAGSGKPQKKQRDNEKLVKQIMGNPLIKKIAYKMVCGFAKDEMLSGVTTIRTVGGLGVLTPDSGMKSRQKPSPVQGFWQPIREFPCPADIWQVP